MLRDIIDKTDKWGNNGKSGRIDPFVEIYDVSCPRDVLQLMGLVLSPTFSAGLRHDRPDDYMPRPDKKRSRSQEDRRVVLDTPDQLYPHLLALTLVPELGEEDSKAGYDRSVHHDLRLRRDQEARGAYK